MFASAGIFGKWRGDYLLLTDYMTEEQLQLSRRKGIKVLCSSIFSQSAKLINLLNRSDFRYPTTVLLKLLLFSPAFRQWTRIAYVDSDFIVLREFSEAFRSDILAAVRDPLSFRKQFVPELPNKLRTSWRVTGPAFNSGFFAFPTLAIMPDLFQNMVATLPDALKYARFADQTILNLHLRDNWHALDTIYNHIHPYGPIELSRQNRNLHFAGKHKPWHPTHRWFHEWGRLALQSTHGGVNDWQ
jgi:lipopolysaccharide biosynthesis glycosyltransferase